VKVPRRDWRAPAEPTPNRAAAGWRAWQADPAAAGQLQCLVRRRLLVLTFDVRWCIKEVDLCNEAAPTTFEGVRLVKSSFAKDVLAFEVSEVIPRRRVLGQRDTYSVRENVVASVLFGKIDRTGLESDRCHTFGPHTLAVVSFRIR
jgi:hypothetical protein